MSPRPLGRLTRQLLATVQNGHRHGADIMHATGLGGGTVYKVLRRLEERGLIEGQWEDAEIAEVERRPRRRYYRITPAGRVEVGAAPVRVDDVAPEGGR